MMGAEAQQGGFGTELASRAGFFHFIGWPDQEMVGFSYPYTDTNSPPLAAIAILAALEYRNRTGKGQYIDLSQHEVAVHHLAPAVLDYTANRREGGRIGNRHPSASPHGVYRCKGEERWCAIAIFSDAEWEAFCNVIGNPSWTNNRKFTTLLSRKQNEDEIDTLVAEWTINFTAQEIMVKMQSHGISAGVVQTAEDLHQDPQLKHRRHFWKLPHPEIGTYTCDSPAFKLSRTPCELSMPAPCLGEHNEHICTKILGMSDEEFVELDKAGVLR